MSSEITKIFIVDDDPAARMILADEFDSQEYELDEFADGESCLSALDKRPDIILMDVEMPGMDGYEICRRIKADNNNKDIDVIFISSHDSTKEKLAGYDAGGSDYLIKPVQAVELKQKIALSIQNQKIRAESAAGQKMAMETAMTAMTSAGEQGVVLEFLRNSFSAFTITNLARMIVDSVSKFDLENSVQLRADNEVINSGTREPVPPLEEELLMRLKDQDRIITRGQRSIFNYGTISLLVKNMPEDEDKAGRLRDHLAILLEGASNRLDALVVGNKLKLLIKDSNRILHDVAIEQQEHKKNGQQIMDSMLQDLEASFLSWGLTEDQEATLLKVVQHGIDNSLEHLEKGQKIDDKMGEIYQRLADFS